MTQDPAVIEWLDVLAAPESTTKSYLQAIRDFTAVTDRTPTELIKKAKSEVRLGIPRSETNLKGYFIKFRRFLYDKNLADTTVRARLAGLKSFYALHDIDVPKLPRRGVRGKARPKKENKLVPSKEDIQDVLKYVTLWKRLIC